MKKLLLLLIAVPMIGLSQSNLEIDVVEFVDDEANIWVYTYPKKKELFEKENNKYKDSILYEEYSDIKIYNYILRQNMSKEYFNIDKILDVFVYNYKSDLLCTAKYINTVYKYDEMNGYSYYHVFKPIEAESINPSIYFTSNQIKSEKSVYFISNYLAENNNLIINEYKNNSLDDIFISEYISGSDEYEISHFELLNNNNSTIYSRVTICNHENGLSKSYIIETKNRESNILLTHGVCIWDAIPTKIFINNKPVFVGMSGMWHYYPSKWILE